MADWSSEYGTFTVKGRDQYGKGIENTLTIVPQSYFWLGAEADRSVFAVYIIKPTHEYHEYRHVEYGFRPTADGTAMEWYAKI